MRRIYFTIITHSVTAFVYSPEYSDNKNKNNIIQGQPCFEWNISDEIPMFSLMTKEWSSLSFQTTFFYCRCSFVDLLS